MVKKILVIVGSLRKNSFNHQLAQKVQELAGDKAEFSFLDYSKVPVFNQDLENPVLPEITRIREEILAADAIWIFSPTYNFSIPGPVKNLLDWVSRSLDLTNPSGVSALHEKVVTVSSVANGGQEQLFKLYQALLPFMRMTVRGDFTAVKVNPEAWTTGSLLVDEEVESNLTKQLKALLQD